MPTALQKAAWVDRVFTKLSKLDPQATIGELLVIAEKSYSAADVRTPEAWAECHVRMRRKEATGDRQWRLDFWARVFELEPRLSLVDAWDLWETASGDPGERARSAGQAAEHIMGVNLPPMTNGQGGAPDDALDGFTITVAGATPQQMERALAAVRALFDASGFSPSFAASAAFTLESWGKARFPADTPLSSEVLEAAELWHGITECIVNAAFGATPPPNASSLVDLCVPMTSRTLH